MLHAKPTKRRRPLPRRVTSYAATAADHTKVPREFVVRADSDPATILRIADVASFLGISRATLWRWTRTGAFAKPHSFGPNVVGWTLAEVREWIRSRTGAPQAVDTQSPTAAA
jgi:prophage regulatory protein